MRAPAQTSRRRPPGDVEPGPIARAAGGCLGASSSCPMPPSFSPSVTGGGPQFCDWHAWTMRRPCDEPAPTFQDFERWLERLRRYCIVWTHYTPAELWELVQGKPIVLATPHRCSERCTLPA